MFRCLEVLHARLGIWRIVALGVGLAVWAWPGTSAAQFTDLLPDIITRTSDLYDNDIVTTIEPGRTHLRLSNGTPNLGPGPLHLTGQLRPTDSGVVVSQRIFRTNGTYWERIAGLFVYHAGHSHMHFEGWAGFRLREVLPDDNVGAVVAESEKTSFCIIDLGIYDNSLPNFDPDGQFFDCASAVQGLSVGWIDVYSKGLSGQNIDITDVPDGEYWLESEADPENRILESDETNNVARIKVFLNGSGTVEADAYEPNDDRASVDARPPGGPNSPNLGPANPMRTVTGLSIHSSGNDDYFRFYANETGAAGDLVQITFQHGLGDLDMHLLDQDGFLAGSAAGVGNVETIPLTGHPEGWYYVRVFGYNGATNPGYTLTVVPPANNPPTVAVIDPPLGDVARIYGYETYTTTWTAADPENDLTWVTVYLNGAPALDGNEFRLETALNIPGSVGFHVLNSSEFPEGTYWVYCEITDGGTTTGSWSNGTVTFTIPADSDGDGIIDLWDNCPYFPNPDQIGCIHHGDPLADGVTDVLDVVRSVEVAFREGTPYVDATCPHAPAGRTDVDCDGVTNVIDLVMIVDIAFRDGVAAFCDPCACESYPTNCP